ncbi:hypothetical protein HK100_002313 [Physocladia obscura]|uniref:C2H2-type domain-containing protein n=1 Tax=Physocladia obscura TaxID=109957 RepID=A0AAD5SY70_9FUNG|nr:hypothetical protein HK100_002313 [Physocladia obscura]
MSPVATPLISNQNLHPSTTPLMMSVTTSADAEMALYLQQQQFLQQQHQQNQMNAISETAFAQSLADMDVQIFRKPFEHFTSEQFTAQALPSVTTAAVILPLPETLEPSLPPNLDDDMNFVDAADVSSLSRSFSEHAIRRPSLSFYLTVPSTKKSTRVSPPSPYHGFYSQSKPISRSSTPLPPARSSPVPCFTTSPIAAAESCSLQSEPASNTAPRSSSSASSLQSFAISQSSSSLTASTLSSSKLSRPAKKSFKIDGSSVAASAPHSHPFQCPVEPCTRTYKSKSSLDHHVTTFHGGQRRFSCTEKGCGKRYQTKNRLTVHMRSHTGEMPYECKFDGCSFAAAQKCALTHHQKRKMHFHVSANNRGSVAADGTDDGEEEMDDFVGKEENMET